MEREKEPMTKVALKAQCGTLLGKQVFVVVLPWGSLNKSYVVASPLLASLGRPVVNVRSELSKLGVHNFKLKSVHLPGNFGVAKMHLVTTGNAMRIIRRSTDERKPDRRSMRQILDESRKRKVEYLEEAYGKWRQPELPLNTTLPPVPGDVVSQGDNGAKRVDELLALVDSLRRTVAEQQGRLDEARTAIAVRDQKIARLEEVYDNMPPVPGVPTPIKTIQARIREHMNSYARKQIEMSTIDTSTEHGRAAMSEYTHALWEWVYKEFKYSAKVDIVARHENLTSDEQAKCSKLDLACKLGLGDKLYAMIYDRLPVKKLQVG